jgi:hypothetical protein
MLKVRDKIKVSGISAVIVKIVSDTNIEIIYNDKGYRILDNAILTNGLWKFTEDGVSGRKLKDSEYSDYEI